MAAHAYPVRRNTILLAVTLVLLSGVIQLAVAVATIALVLVTGIESILGLGPAIFITAGALAALPAGRLMDRFGRVPVIAGGFALGAVACVVTALGCAVDSAVLVIVGFLGVGAMNGGVLLARTAAADMVPPERKARAISYVLFGALFGAALGPLVFRPLFAGKELELDTLVVPWLAAAGIALVGVVVALLIRPDPRTVALELQRAGLAPGDEPRRAAPAAPLREILLRPGVPSAVLAALVSFGVMASVMNLSGYIVVGHDHEQADVFTVISLHIVGMYALVLVIGALIDRVGRRRCLIAGLAVMAVSTVMLAWVETIAWTSVSLFLLGLGWNLSYVAASAELVTHAAPVERGRLVGFTDLLAGLLAASFALLGGLAYSEWGAAAIAAGATLGVVAPALVILLARRAPPAAAPEPAG
ncbi:MAG TPA: MFS transporter [Gaiellaceae bacterium]|nr:MFS transporter [Gaiellaceae bacterium]